MGNLSLLLAAVMCLAPAMAQERRNWFDDPFAQATKGQTRCPVPEGPLLTEAEMRASAHARAERGTRCWLEKKCDSPNAYRYDQRINENVVTRLGGDPRFADSSVWALTQRGFVFLQGCVRAEKQRKMIIGAVAALPRVERVIDELQVGTGGKPPYKVAGRKR